MVITDSGKLNAARRLDDDEKGIHSMDTLGGEPWFVAADVCKVLEIADARQAVERLDDDERG